MIDLKGRVIDAEALAQHRLHVTARGVAVVLTRDQHVGGERGEAARDLPHVQVVDLDDARLGDERAADGFGVESLRRGLEEHAARGLQQRQGRSRHQPGDEQRRDRVGALEARE